jgi:hypothetical protein
MRYSINKKQRAVRILFDDHCPPMDMVRSSVIPFGGTCTAAALSLCCNDRQSEISSLVPGGKLKDLVIQDGGE